MGYENKELNKLPPHLEIAKMLPAEDMHEILTCRRTYYIPINKVKGLSQEAQSMLSSFGMVDSAKLADPNTKYCSVSVTGRYQDKMYG